MSEIIPRQQKSPYNGAHFPNILRSCLFFSCDHASPQTPAAAHDETIGTAPSPFFKRNIETETEASLEHLTDVISGSNTLLHPLANSPSRRDCFLFFFSLYGMFMAFLKFRPWNGPQGIVCRSEIISHAALSNGMKARQLFIHASWVSA